MRIFYCDSSPCACRRVSPAQRLPLRGAFLRRTPRHAPARSSCGASPSRGEAGLGGRGREAPRRYLAAARARRLQDRKSVVEGTRVSVRVAPGGSRILKKKKKSKKNTP